MADPVVPPVAVPAPQLLDLDAIKAREQEATSGPWTNGMRDSGDAHMCRVFARREADPPKGAYGEQVALTWHPEFMVSYVGLSHQQNVHNAEFIAHARQDIPALIAEIERLRAAPARSRAALEQVISEISLRYRVNEIDDMLEIVVPTQFTDTDLVSIASLKQAIDKLLTRGDQG